MKRWRWNLAGARLSHSPCNGGTGVPPVRIEAHRQDARATTVLRLFPFLITASALAQDDLPKLRPPRGEIPPTFWEQHGTAIIIASVACVLVVGILVWLLSRPKARKPIPPEVIARRELETLRQKPEDGATLSRISQILRRYFADAFKLSSDELTTTEFCRAISDRSSIGESLAAELSDFLRQCDERKFAPDAAGPPNDAVGIALKLIDQAEARRAELRQAAAAADAQKERTA